MINSNADDILRAYLLNSPDVAALNGLEGRTDGELAAVGGRVVIGQAGRGNKFHAVRTEVEGIIFDSKAEARRYQELRLLERDGQIRNLQCQPKYEFIVNGVKVASYRPDFRYEQNGRVIHEDVKSKATKTRDYRIRKKLMMACYGLEVVEVE